MTDRATGVHAETSPHGMLVDLQSNPVGVSVDGPRFTWIVPMLGDGLQRAYRLQVASDAESFEDPVWDSRWVETSASVSVSYQGGRLDESTPYWWRVCVATSVLGSWSEPARFITAMGTWPAKPIWGPIPAPASREEHPNSWVLLRTEFELPDRPVRTAFVEAAGLSPEDDPAGARESGSRQYVYKLWANGTVVGRGSVRASTAHARYHTHHVTDQLRPGGNALAALCWAEHGRQFIGRLVVILSDGERIEITTGQEWRALSGADLLPGVRTVEGGWYRAPREFWDMRAEPVGWTEAGFDDSRWASAGVSEVLPPAPAPAVVNIEQFVGEPIATEQVTGGRWMADLGREIVGGLRLQVDGELDAQLTVRLGEELDDGRPRSLMRTGNNYEETWTLRQGDQRVEHWGYRAFRYIEVETESSVDLSNAISPVVLRSPYVGGGAFKSSDSSLDRVWELCRYSIEATSLDLYMDTPSRERLPYEGDMFVNQLSQYAVERNYALARYSGEYLTRRSTWPTEYHLMPAIMAWEDYMNTGDRRQLFADFEHWLELNYDRFLGEDDLLHKDRGVPSEGNADLVDWPATCRDDYEFTKVNTVVNSFQWAAYDALSKIAESTDRTEAAARFGTAASRMRAGINRELLDESAYRDGATSTHHAQHATAIPVALGVAPKDRLGALGAHLAAGGIRTSIYGAQFLLDALCASGRSKEAMALITDRGTSSWLHLIDALDATIVGEAWDPSLKPNMTYSHAWGSAPANVIARWILGVQITSPGAARITIAPRPGDLDWMSGTVPTIRGQVGVRYVRAEGLLEIDVPPNVLGTVVLDMEELGVTGECGVESSSETHLDATSGQIRLDGVYPGRTTVRLR